jgi:hypothetical protein
VRIRTPAVLTTAGVFFILRTLRRAGPRLPSALQSGFFSSRSSLRSIASMSQAAAIS